MEMAEAYERLDRVMNEQRVHLRMSWRDLANTAGVSEAALRAIRRGHFAPTELTAVHIDDALQWLPGSTRAVLSGGDPTAREERVDAQEIRDALQAAMEIEDPEEMRAALKDLLTRMPPASGGGAN